MAGTCGLMAARGREGPLPWARDVGMEGVATHGVAGLHQHQGSQDSSDSGSLPPSYSRLPPDGHEFPEDYVDPALGFPGREAEYLSRKSSASSTASLDRHELRLTLAGRKFAGLEDKVSGVRAKIAMFSNSQGKSGPGKLGKFQSSEDVGKLSGSSNSLTRAHTHGDVRFDEGVGKRASLQSPSLKCLGPRPESAGPAPKSKLGQTGLSSKAPAAFRSMIDVSSAAEPAAALQPGAASVTDLSSVKEAPPGKPGRGGAPAISSRSQSLNEIGAAGGGGSAGRRHPDISVTGRSRSSTGVAEALGPRKSSMTSLIEQRRRSTMSKLKGLVIPEGTEAGDRGLAGRHKAGAGRAGTAPPAALPSSPLEVPKYSPAFKRKPFTVYGTKKSEKGEAVEEAGAPHSKPPIGKRNSEESIASPAAHKTEDSDNDSAVSSGLSSLSGRSCSPGQSPRLHRPGAPGARPAHEPVNPRVLKKNSVEAINRQNVLNACKKSSPPAAGLRAEDLRRAEREDPPLETSSPRAGRPGGRPASRSSSFTIQERKKSFEAGQELPTASSRRSSNSSQDSGSRRGSREPAASEAGRRSSREVVEEANSRRSSRVPTPTGSSCFPDSILDLEEKVAYMSDVVDRAASTTPTERSSLSRTDSLTSERSTYSSRSSRNSSIVSDKVPFNRNNSILSKDSAISEDIGLERREEERGRWAELGKKYGKPGGQREAGNKLIEDKISQLTEGPKRPKDLAITHKKLSAGAKSPSSKNFKELAEKWQTISVDSPTTPTAVSASSATLPRKASKERAAPITVQVASPPAARTLPRRLERQDREEKLSDEAPWSPGPPTGHPMENPYYQVNGEMEGREWSGFEMAGKCDIPDRKFSVPAYNEASVKLRDKRDTMPSRPSSLIESSEQKDLKIFEIGNLGDERRLRLNSNSISQSSSQADLLDSHSVTSDTPKSPLPSSSSREILDVFSNRNNRRAVSVNDIRRAFEKAEQSLSNSGTPKRLGLSTSSSHNRMSSLDSTTSEESSIPTPHFHGSVSSLTSGHGGLKDHYGSITSLASSTSMISPQELQNLIDEANQSLEESGTPSHEIMVIVLHREYTQGGSIGVTLAGGADYESKEITVHKVIAGSLADRDGRIQKGDRVLSINGRSTKGVSHREALSILKAPRAEVVLVLSRSRSVTPADRGNYDLIEAGYNYINSSRPPKILESPLDSKSLMADLKFVDVPRGQSITVTLKKEGTGLGFSLEGGKDSPYGDRPMTVKKIFTGGAADKNGVLRVGDEILSVNNVDVTRMTRLEAWNFMKKLNDGSQVVVVRQKLEPHCLKPGREVPVVKTELVGEEVVPEEKTH